MDKLHIQLQGINRQRGDHIQRRVARAEVIHFNMEAQCPKLLCRVYDLLGILRIGGLRNFQHQVGRCKSVFRKDRFQGSDQVRIIQVDA